MKDNKKRGKKNQDDFQISDEENESEDQIEDKADDDDELLRRRRENIYNQDSESDQQQEGDDQDEEEDEDEEDEGEELHTLKKGGPAERSALPEPGGEDKYSVTSREAKLIISKLAFLKILCLLFGVVSLTIFMLSWICYSDQSISMVLTAGIFSSLCILLAIFGIIITFRYEKNVKMNLKVEGGKQGQQYLNSLDCKLQIVFSYLAFFFFLASLSIGVLCLVLKSQSLAQIESQLYTTYSTSSEDYQDQIDAALESWTSIILSIGSLSIINAVVGLAMAVVSFQVSKNNEHFHMPNQFMNLIQVLSTTVILCFIALIYHYRYFYQLEDYIRVWPFICIVVSMFFVKLLTFLQLNAIYHDEIQQMSVIGALNTLVFIANIVFVCFIVVDITEYKNNFDCYESMSIINEDDFTSFTCASKYSYTSNTIGDLVTLGCDLEAVRYKWEDQYDDDSTDFVVACLNSQCCDETLYDVKAVFDFLIYFVFLLSVVGITNYIILMGLVTYLQMVTTQRLTHDLQEKILGSVSFAFLVAALVYYFVWFPSGPTYMDNLILESSQTVTMPAIEERFISFDGYFDIYDIIIIEDTDACDDSCPTLTYLVDLKVNYGSLRFNTAYDQSAINVLIDEVYDTDGYELQFNGTLDDVNEALDLFEYMPICPFDTNNKLSISIYAYNYDYYYTGQTVSADMGESVTISKTGEYEILTKTVTYTFDQYQNSIVGGRILQQTSSTETVAVSGASIAIASDLFTCSSWDTVVTSDTDGTFWFSTELISGNRPYKLYLTITATDLETISKEIIVGGIFHSVSGTDLSLGTYILTYDNTETYRSENIIVQAYDATSFEVLSDVTVEMKSGSDVLGANDTTTLRTETTDEDGQFKFLAVDTGFYSLYGSKENYYEDYFTSPIIGADTPTLPNLYLLPAYSGDDNLWIRMTYNQNDDASANLYSYFNITEDDQVCFVSFIQRECGGQTFYADVSNPDMAVQSIKFSQFGDYQYLLFVSLYTESDVSLSDLNPKISIISNIESLNIFDVYMPYQAEEYSDYTLWVIGCFSGKKGLQYFELVNVILDSDFGTAYVEYCL